VYIIKQDWKQNSQRMYRQHEAMFFFKHAHINISQQTTHNHKSKITSKVSRLIGMTNSIQQWHKRFSRQLTITYSHHSGPD